MTPVSRLFNPKMTWGFVNLEIPVLSFDLGLTSLPRCRNGSERRRLDRS